MSDRNNDTTATKVFVIISLLMSSSLLLIVLSSGSNNGIIVARAQAPEEREPTDTPTSNNNSTYALNLGHRLAITSVNASKTQARLGTQCLPELSRFILPRKDAKFDVIKQCVTI
ncbi:MAG TPA: hypothetical protein VFJ51_07955, partial [Nitrososphaeraceae archaeon]|nr:hypothetical protein [Nitrososphaeraceae archaeon]